MNAKKLALSLFALVAVAAFGYGQARAAEITYFVATDSWDPFGLFGAPIGAVLVPPTVICPGSAPTGDPMQICPPGSRIHLQDMKHLSRFDSPDPRFTGWATVGDHVANYDADAAGLEVGTLSLLLDNGVGTWEGTWTGRRVREGDHWIHALLITAHGTSGTVNGLQAVWMHRFTTYTPVPLAYFAVAEGRLLEP